MSAQTASRVAQSNPANDQRNKILAGAAGILIAAAVLYFELSDPSPKAPAPQATTVPPIAAPSNPSPRATASAVKSGTPVTTPPGAAARSIGTTSAALDPTLHMQAMLVTESVAYNGSGRNIFAPSDAISATPIAIPKPIAPVRTPIGPPIATQPSGPPPPPPIDLKFFGTSTNQAGRRQAFLLHGDDVFLAADGDIVQRKYKVITVGPRSVQIEDLTNNNKQTLPLVTSPGTSQ